MLPFFPFYATGGLTPSPCDHAENLRPLSTLSNKIKCLAIEWLLVVNVDVHLLKITSGLFLISFVAVQRLFFFVQWPFQNKLFHFNAANRNTIILY